MEPYNDYEEYNDYSDHHVLRHQVGGLAFALSLVVLVFVYLPLLTIGYIISFHILSSRDSAFVWIGSILFFAGASYMTIQKLKQKMQSLRMNGNLAWIPLFIFCVAITCIQTPWIAYYPISHLCECCHWPHFVAWVLDLGIGLLTYSRYDFLRED